MTVIAFDGRMIATDTLMTVAGIRMVPHYEKVKIKRYQEGSVLYAQTGAAGWLDAWIAWDEEGADPANTPPSKIPAHESGQILKWDEGILYRLIPEHPYWLTLGSTLDAFGSGADVATGADAFTAAAIALRRVSGCGGTVLNWWASHPDPEAVWRPLERCACRKCNDWFVTARPNTTEDGATSAKYPWFEAAVARVRASHRYDPDTGTLERISYPAHAETACPCASCDPPFSAEPVLRSSIHHPRCNVWSHNIGTECDCRNRHCDCLDQVRHHDGCKWHLTVYDIKECKPTELVEESTHERASYPAHAGTVDEAVSRHLEAQAQRNDIMRPVRTEAAVARLDAVPLDEMHAHLSTHPPVPETPKCHHNMHGTVSNSGTGEVRCANCNERMCACPDEATPFVYHWSNCASLNAENQDCDCGAKVVRPCNCPKVSPFRHLPTCYWSPDHETPKT